MAYKFQRGAATLSGSIKAEDGLDANSAGFAGAGAIAGATTVNASGEGTFGSLKIDDGSTIGSDTKGDAITIAANGDTEIADGCDFNIDGHNGTDTGLKLSGSLVTSTAAELNKLDGAGADVTAAKLTTLSALTNAEIAFLDGASTANNTNAARCALLDASNNLTIAGNLTVNGTTTTVDTTNLLVKDKLITINDGGAASSAGGAGIEFEEDGSATGFIKTSADRAEFELQAPANNNTLTIDMDAAGEIQFDSAKKITVAGDLTINADTTISAFGASIIDDADAATARTTLGLGNMAEQANGSVNIDGGDIASAVVINKSPVVNFNSGDVQGSITLTNLGNGTGGLTIQAGAVEHGMLAEDIISGQAELNNSGDLAAADDMMIHDNDAGEVKKVGLDTLRTFFQTGVTADTAGGFSYNTYNATSSAIANAAGSPGFYAASGSSASSPLSGTVATTLHLSGGASAGDNDWSNGMVVYIKAPSNASSFNLTVVASGSERIDGEQQIVLESDNAAVTLLRCHNSRWSIV